MIARTPYEASYDVICFSHLRWDFVFQRPQHLLSRCAREHRVFFVEEPTYDASEPALEVEASGDGVQVVTPHLPAWYIEAGRVPREAALKALLAELMRSRRIRDFVLWYYTPMALGFTRHLQPLAMVYDCMDELSTFASAPPALTQREEELFSRADLVFTGGRSLYEAKRDRHPHVYAFPSSVDAHHFARAREPQPDPIDQGELGHPRLGYFGVIDERMDLDLLARLADRRPDWRLVLVGPVAKIDPGALPRRSNIHYLGSKPYDDLPRYLAGWDVAMLPFAHNASTRFISPTKTPEYLAGGKPVISTAIHDVVDPYGTEGYVRIAETAEEWVCAVVQLLAESERDTHARIERVDRMLGRTSWDRTWAHMQALLDDVVRARMQASPQPAGRRDVDTALASPRSVVDGSEATSEMAPAPAGDVEAVFVDAADAEAERDEGDLEVSA